MIKKIFFLSFLIFCNVCICADPPLKGATLDFMGRASGSMGIQDQKGTPEQLRQMVDGCITAGIIDKLYNFPDQSDLLKGVIDSLASAPTHKQLHAKLAFAFYAIGYGMQDEQTLKAHLGAYGVDFDDLNFRKEFNTLCLLVFQGPIYQYRNRLETVIKRTSKPLQFDDFIEERFYTPEEYGEIPARCQRMYSRIDKTHDPKEVSDDIIQMCPEFKRKYTTKAEAAARRAASEITVIPPLPSPVVLDDNGLSPIVTPPATAAFKVPGQRPLLPPPPPPAAAADVDNRLSLVGFPSREAFIEAGNKAGDFEVYAKMLKIGLSPEVVKQKMNLAEIKFPK